MLKLIFRRWTSLVKHSAKFVSVSSVIFLHLPKTFLFNKIAPYLEKSRARFCKETSPDKIPIKFKGPMSVKLRQLSTNYSSSLDFYIYSAKLRRIFCKTKSLFKPLLKLVNVLSVSKLHLFTN